MFDRKRSRGLLKSIYTIYCIIGVMLLVLIPALGYGNVYSNIIDKESIIESDTVSFFKDIKVRKAYKLIIENSGNHQFVILDVRSEDEHSEGNIANSININYKSSDFQSKLDILDKSKIYLVYCVAGYRSKKSANIMKDKGFKYIYNMKGGMMKWKAKKLPVVKSSQ